MPTKSNDASAHITHALDVLRSLPYGAENGRPLNISAPGRNPADGSESPDHFLRLLFQDIADVVGADFLSTTDPVLLEQFCIMSIHRVEPSGEVLKALLISFMQAYADPARSEAAMAYVRQLMQPSTNAAPSEPEPLLA